MNKTIVQTALKMLARREHSIQELSQKLKLKKFEDNDIQEVMALLEQKKYVNDARFGEMYVRHRSNRGYGKLRIEAELKEKGLSPTLIKKVLDEHYEADIKKIYEKKFGTFNYSQFKKLEFKEKAKRMRYLQYKGFSPEDIHQLFHQ